MSVKKRGEPVGVLVVVAGLYWSPWASACSWVEALHELEPEQQAVDESPPSPPEGAVNAIRRGKGPVHHPGGYTSVTSCDDGGVIDIQIVSTGDDGTSAEKIGYRLSVVDGEVPIGFEPQRWERAHRASEEPDGSRHLYLHWPDGDTDAQEAFDFAAVLVAVDLAGHESAPSSPIRIQATGLAAADVEE